MFTLPKEAEIAKMRRWALREAGSAEVALSITPTLLETQLSLEAANLVLDVLDRMEASRHDPRSRNRASK